MNTTATSYSSEHSWIAPGSRRGSIESILSIQGKETDFVCDTSDTESLGDEYEPVTEPEDSCGEAFGDSSGESEKDIISTKVIEVTVGDDGDLVFADSEQTDSDGSDSEIDLYDYWRCAQCRAANNNPLYRYCEKCFKVRKNLFPPRPRPKPRLKTSSDVNPLYHTDSGVDSAFNSQELSHTQSDLDVNVTPQPAPEPSPEPVNCVKSENESPVEHSASDNINPVKSNPDSTETVLSVTPSPGLTLPSIVNRVVTRVKRRAESADRDRKRLKIDYSDTDSDSDNDRRVRKSKSADPEVKPLTKTISDPALTIDAVSSRDGLCIMCCSEPKSGVFVHGRIAHICCCYRCAVKVWAKSKRCPVCNCKVSNVLKAVVM